jgi:lipoprotein-anchoring transpeptidase ErfK/SrfK
MREDATSWVPARPLDYGRGYSATVTATGSDGQRVTRTAAFTTRADPGSRRINTGLYFADGQTYGVGMPVVVEFDRDIPARDRAAVERRLFVTSDPPQVGVWHWYGGRQVLYRPEKFWQPGTKLTVRAALGGLPVAGRVIDRDRGGSATIGAYQSFRVDNATKTMSVYQNGLLRKVFPVSLGKHSTPTSSGNLVIMTHQYVTVFDTPLYRITAYYDERITWDGEFFHAAPWSEGEQGHRNVSHGCVNLSVRNARWVYRMAQIGDPVTVLGTEVHVTPGDGWTVWDMPWLEYLHGSALPHPDLLAVAQATALPESRAERLGR